MIGLVLFWVGAVLVLNGLWLLGRISDREIAVINIFTGGVALLAALVNALRPGATIVDVGFGTLVLLFAFTYLWIALNTFLRADGRGLGWYSLFVAITALPVGIEVLRSANTTFLYWLGASWVAWAVLWFMYWLLLVPKRITASTAGMATIAVGIGTAWLPGYLLVRGYLGL